MGWGEGGLTAAIIKGGGGYWGGAPPCTREGSGGGVGVPPQVRISKAAQDEQHSGLLLVNLGQIRLSFFGVCRSIFDDNIKNGKCQKVGIILLIEKTLVN